LKKNKDEFSGLSTQVCTPTQNDIPLLGYSAKNSTEHISSAQIRDDTYFNPEISPYRYVLKIIQISQEEKKYLGI